MAEDTGSRPVAGRRDWLVPWSVAADTLNRTKETLTSWHEKGFIPAVRTPAGDWFTYASWLADVMASARPGKAGEMAEVTRDWWARHEARKAAA